MTYHERVLALRAESKRTAFDFRFEDLWFFIFYGGKVKLPAFFNTQKAQLPL
ncbi:hypothetical protein KUH180062_1991 [Staphylococcus aureus]|nr:hypothetical protein KUH180062_1991 [Staphylococcus aureus]